jgi:periplasmic mercuric ion binding protein
MKSLRIFLTVLFAGILGVTTSAQTHEHMNMDMPTAKTETFKVWGNCDLCKARIEKAVEVEGVTNADWSTKTKLLTVTFDPSKTNKDVLSKNLALAGHDTEKYKATGDVYAKLPGCCQYERAK